MSFNAGELRDRVVDVIQNSRIYCPTPDLFNDPYYVSPVIKHGGDPKDPKYIAELDRNERLMMKRRGMSEQQTEAFRATDGVNVDRLADEARDDLWMSRPVPVLPLLHSFPMPYGTLPCRPPS